MRTVIAGAAVLCLLAAQPASAAWTTSGQGSAGAKAAAVTVPTGLACSRSTGAVTWQAVQGATGYDVWWSDKDNNGGGNFTGPIRVTSPSYTVTNGTPLRAKVRSVAGTWQSAQSPDANCP
ncbi:hypothetical protein [Lentzea sp. NPDC059081]|uniref:hypothetical protein n=1 Tax=Lentzea sp. NPDC059081 TaxID=3346719 RepID=UPI00369F4788